MQVKVYLTGDSDMNVLRLVNLPDEELEGVKPYENDADLVTFLDGVFTYGQNDFQPVPPSGRCRSLVVGDLIEFNSRYHLIQSFGFKTMDDKEMNDYMAMSPDDRRWSRFCRPSPKGGK